MQKKIKIYKEKWAYVFFYKKINKKRTKIKTKKYSISNFGNVRNNENGKLLSLIINNKGYATVHLYIDEKRIDMTVHRLIGYAFLGHPISSKKVINHKDSNRSNNFFKNLEWCSQTYNVIDSFSSKHGNSRNRLKYNEETIIHICEVIQKGEYRNKKICKVVGLKFNKNNCGLLNEIKFGNRRYKWIVKNYDFSKAIENRNNEKEKRSELIHSICKCLEMDKPYDEICKINNLKKNRKSYDLIRRIKHKEQNIKISSQYNF